MARKLTPSEKGWRTRWERDFKAGKPLSEKAAVYIAHKKAWGTRWRKEIAKGKVPTGTKGKDFYKRLGPDRVPRARPSGKDRFLSEQKAAAYVYVEEPVGRLEGDTGKKKKRR
jgi:hypothetical protein